MKLSEFEAKLLRAARQAQPGAHVPYAFEKRIMARLAARRPESPWVWWSVSLWRGAAACAIVTVLCATWSCLTPKPPATPPVADLSQEFQSAVFASMTQPTEDGS